MICWGNWDFSIHIRSALSSYRLCRCFQGSCYCQFVTRSWGRLEWVIDSFFPAYYEVVMITNYVGPLKVSEHKYRYVITLFNYRSFEDQWLGCMQRVMLWLYTQYQSDCIDLSHPTVWTVSFVLLSCCPYRSVQAGVIWKQHFHQTKNVTPKCTC